MTDSRLAEALTEVALEVQRAAEKFPLCNSAHEVYGVLSEELAEFFDEVRKKGHMRSALAMRRELAQVAAVAIRGMAMIDSETVKR